MKNLFFVKESAWAIITTLIIIAIYFIAIGFGADKENVLAVAALAAALVAAFTAFTAFTAVAAAVAFTAFTAFTAVAAAAVAFTAFTAVAAAVAFTAFTAVIVVAVFVAVVVSIIAGKEKPFSFGKIFFSLIVFLILAGIGMYFVFSGNYLPGFVLVGAGISFLIILNTLDIVVQFSREPSIFAKKARRAGSYE